MKITFNIIVVSLNAGNKVDKTLKSIFEQTFTNFYVVLKDGGSTDGSYERMLKLYGTDKRFLPQQRQDDGIYDAMNQALSEAKERYVLFLNCGDTFLSDQVLEKAANEINQFEMANKDRRMPFVFYGDTFKEESGTVQYADPKITEFTCYRNVPCHQSCFFETKLFLARQFLPEYRIRADYELFLWCYYLGDTQMVYLNMTIASYEGGGFSESKFNRERDKKEHRMITRKYMDKSQCDWYRFLLRISFSSLRTKLAKSRRFSKGYEQLKKKLLYRKGTTH
ncbi:MAG: glycosyltransferase [Lachnospiraceae bacterium]|jgi:glycosyltransferase involved in cell wall biosynthesis|nr:glycosyltransferase [Lachnospiraceae bacterium]